MSNCCPSNAFWRPLSPLCALFLERYSSLSKGSTARQPAPTERRSPGPDRGGRERLDNLSMFLQWATTCQPQFWRSHTHYNLVHGRSPRQLRGVSVIASGDFSESVYSVANKLR